MSRMFAGLSSSEQGVAVSLAGVYSTRMFGLFMIVPIFAKIAEGYPDYTPFLAGLAIGLYGLTQAILQIPFGRLSDKIGRKPVIIGGLVIFAAGSVLAAVADSLLWVAVGRALQGTGAIASSLMALAADLTREEHRIKVMAFIGMSIGLSFMLAIILGPIVHGLFGISGIFWLTALLALAGIAIILFRVPTPVSARFHRDTEVEISWLRHVLADSQLLRVDLGVMILHCILMSSFIALPFMFQSALHLDVSQHWRIYLPVLFLSMGGVLPLIIVAEKKRMIKQMLIIAILCLILAEQGLRFFGNTLAGLTFMVLLFFVAFNFLEASLPSLIAKLAPATHKGTAMGVFSSSQFFGVFVGGTAGGWLLQQYGISSILWFNTALLSLWLLLAISMQAPKYHGSYLLNVGKQSKEQARKLAEQLAQIVGVVEATVIAEDGVAYLKIEREKLNEQELMVFSIQA